MKKSKCAGTQAFEISKAFADLVVSICSKIPGFIIGRNSLLKRKWKKMSLIPVDTWYEPKLINRKPE